MLKKTADLSKIILEVSECSEDGTRDKDQCRLAIVQRPPQERDWVWKR